MTYSNLFYLFHKVFISEMFLTLFSEPGSSQNEAGATNGEGYEPAPSASGKF